MWCYLRVNFLVAIILLAMPSLGGAELMNQDVLTQSKIKKSSFKQIFNDIKKPLPKCRQRRLSKLLTPIRRAIWR